MFALTQEYSVTVAEMSTETTSERRKRLTIAVDLYDGNANIRVVWREKGVSRSDLYAVHYKNLGTYISEDFRLYIGCCDGVRLSSQNCCLWPIVLSPGDSDVDLIHEIG
jgi:hypothetical protein